ncbi:MAG: molybdopterin-dependent oxidoreductase [Isosphaeraceae bacterium]|nr:molybdopterin-dependent oxidoreductase [Isosphaeraceae bacterium]
MDQVTLLKVYGAVEQPLDLTFEELGRWPATAQIADVSRFHPKRAGDGVTLDAILAQARPKPEADFVTLHADRDNFHVSVPLAAVRAEGIVVYKLGDARLGPEHGGPVRFLIRDPAACHSQELDDCANVKYLSRIEVTVGRGRDTRPADEAAHAALHASQSG